MPCAVVAKRPRNKAWGLLPQEPETPNRIPLQPQRGAGAVPSGWLSLPGLPTVLPRHWVAQSRQSKSLVRSAFARLVIVCHPIERAGYLGDAACPSPSRRSAFLSQRNVGYCLKSTNAPRRVNSHRIACRRRGIGHSCCADLSQNSSSARRSP
jgi:hypothetical protein